MIASRYNDGYTTNMKTAISIPDIIFQQAEKAAWAPAEGEPGMAAYLASIEALFAKN